MKLLAMAFALSMAMGTILFLGVWSLAGNGHPEVAGAIGAMPLIAVPHIYDTLERVEARKSVTSGNKLPIRTLEGFSISWPIIVTAGTIVIFGVTNSVGVIAHLIADGLTVPEQSAMATVGLISIPIQLIVGFLLGKWVGARSARNGVGAIILLAALGSAGTKLIDYIVIPADEWSALFLQEKSVATLIGHILFLFGVWAISGLLGARRGRKQRFSKYMHYLLSVLPADTRNALVDLAFDEAKKVVDARRTNQPYSRP